ncbi:4-hydroxybutyrate dehydrogenase [Marinobacter adhaerens]|uniref:Iron-containing alcohol dehydrogenase n=1 Tax=Marinobacter salsuginis TaxID=418719 RepID=A0A5M3PQ22_9GAMM|nr:4-hydroxybutyrate dehydrogenase [Marinobacter adhaerens]GBO84876.1 iron-containing alcohol dehydrogenase [Marinobacter salsuginis]|tara:strand:+ start:2138 stop:3271 length:1134 start_codon:yes stop_codon:yes gene_type:complete
MIAQINYLTNIRLGAGAIASLNDELASMKVSKPLIITDAGLVSSGLLDKVRATAKLSDSVAIYDGTPANPTEAAVEDALHAYRCDDCDGIVAIGGGSSIDLAKAVALLATHERPLRQYAAINGGVARIGPTVPLVAVPTTAGTGSEVGRASLITLNDGRKLGFLSPYLIPDLAICDAELTRSLPAGLTAATGMDAIAHCVETYLSPKINPPADAIALDGLRRASKYLIRAVKDGTDMEARSEMMIAALEGALAFQKGLGGVHSMSHALGGLKELKLHHGTLNAVLLPPVLRFNQSHCGDKFDHLKAAMGLPGDADLPAEFERLNAELGMPKNLRAMGVPDEVLEDMAQFSEEDHSTATNPRPASAEDFLTMLRETMG